MRWVEPTSCLVDIESGAMIGGTGRYEKRMSALRGLYEDEDALQVLIAETHDPIVYDVCEFRPSVAAGDLIFGVTRMSPGRVGREFFLTRGHIHANADRPEVYYGQRGRGLMQLESPDGEMRILEIGPQTVCYVPPYWIHRTVNIGADDLLMMFSYPADSGQDYGIIERSGGLRQRVVVGADGGWDVVDNPAYRPRTADSLDGLAEAHPAAAARAAQGSRV